MDRHKCANRLAPAASARPRAVFTELSAKIGTVLLVLGVLHLGNVFVLSRIRRRALIGSEPQPPVAPTGWVPGVLPGYQPAPQAR